VVDLRTHLKRASRARWGKASAAEKKEAATHAVKAYWASMSKEERSAEMKRRAVVRAKNRKKKGKKKDS
jgi:hypothetical protein